MELSALLPNANRQLLRSATPFRPRLPSSRPLGSQAYRQHRSLAVILTALRGSAVRLLSDSTAASCLLTWLALCSIGKNCMIGRHIRSLLWTQYQRFPRGSSPQCSEGLFFWRILRFEGNSRPSRSQPSPKKSAKFTQTVRGWGIKLGLRPRRPFGFDDRFEICDSYTIMSHIVSFYINMRRTDMKAVPLAQLYQQKNDYDAHRRKLASLKAQTAGQARGR